MNDKPKTEIVNCWRCAGTGRRGWVPGPMSDEHDTCRYCNGAGVRREVVRGK